MWNNELTTYRIYPRPIIIIVLQTITMNNIINNIEILKVILKLRLEILLHKFLYFTFYIFFPKQKQNEQNDFFFGIFFWTIFVYAKQKFEKKSWTNISSIQ